MSMAAEALSQAAGARHQRTVEQAERALRELDAEGAPVSFQAVAWRAGVSRQWLYTQPELRVRIEQPRAGRAGWGAGAAAGQRGVAASAA
jgi:Family of unknown function (DUF6262)